jgi:hypothetical protein
MNDAEILAILRPAPARRVALVVVTGLMGGMLILVGLDAPSGGLALRGAFLFGGVGAFWAGWRVWQATAVDLVLTTQDLRQSDGRVICTLADIEKVERGLAALRPATGFALQLRRAQSFGWVPGLWWRRGTRVGVGGMTTRASSKALAEVIEAELRDRADARPV